MKIKNILRSSDSNVCKFIFDGDNVLVESVLYKYPDYNTRTTICISTQCGCKVGCSFCGTGKKFIRDLTQSEIVEQVVKTFESEGIDTNKVQKLQIMFMSMGEPSHNWGNLKGAILELNNLYPTAQLLISSIGTTDEEFKSDLLDLSVKIPNIGLQFSIHHFSDAERNKLIPFKDKMSLKQIADYGELWSKTTGRQVYCNYVVTKSNYKGIRKLQEIFDSKYFAFTFSVLCNPNESLKEKIESNKQLIEDICNDFLAVGYNVRIFDPAGQDDIGGGCGQLWYFQNFINNNNNNTNNGEM